MSIVGGGCTSSTMNNQCAFVCSNGENKCQFGVKLLNCAGGSQPGAGIGKDPYNGADSGGCHVGGPHNDLRVFFLN
jgi:hypothetical protein